MIDVLDDEHPLWLINEQIKGLLGGDGAGEDHEDVLTFLRATGLPEGTIGRMHKALVFGDAKVRQAELEDKADLVAIALRRAWQLGQTYWQQADSDFISHHRKADETQAKFQTLVDETKAAVVARSTED